MPNHEETLHEKTFKGQCETVGQRVFYTITAAPNLVEHRQAMITSLIVEHLLKIALISDQDLDEILVSCL